MNVPNSQPQVHIIAELNSEGLRRGRQSMGLDRRSEFEDAALAKAKKARAV